MIICIQCKAEKQDWHFRSRVSRHGRMTTERKCRQCSSKMHNGRHRERRYKMVKTFEQMVTEQNGFCAICKGPPQSKGLSVDHCHKTGKVRALLCTNCNLGLGVFKDDLDLMQVAIEYIERYRDEQS